MFPLSPGIRRLRGVGWSRGRVYDCRYEERYWESLMTQVFNAARGTAVPRASHAWWLALRTLRNLRKGLSWAWLDTVCQYRRSKIGPLWETINILVMTLGMTIVSSAVIGGTVTNLIGYIGL